MQKALFSSLASTRIRRKGGGLAGYINLGKPSARQVAMWGGGRGCGKEADRGANQGAFFPFSSIYLG